MENDIKTEDGSLDDFFAKQEPAKQEPAKPRIHTAPGDSKCVSCEG